MSPNRITSGALVELPFERIEGFIDYALAEAKKTKFEPQSIGGIRQQTSCV